MKSFISSLTQPSHESSPPQHKQQQQRPSKLSTAVNAPCTEASKAVPSVTAISTSGNDRGKRGQGNYQVTGSTAAASAAEPTSTACYGSNLRDQPGVSASQDAKVNWPSNTHHSRVEHSLIDRLQPSGASQTTGVPTHDTLQNGASSARPAGLQYPEPPSSSGDSSTGNSPVKVQGVGRVGVESLGGLAWQLEGSDAEVEKQIYVAVFQLKAIVRESRCAAMVSVPAGVPIAAVVQPLVNCLMSPHWYYPASTCQDIHFTLHEM